MDIVNKFLNVLVDEVREAAGRNPHFVGYSNGGTGEIERLCRVLRNDYIYIENLIGKYFKDNDFSSVKFAGRGVRMLCFKLNDELVLKIGATNQHLDGKRLGKENEVKITTVPKNHRLLKPIQSANVGVRGNNVYVEIQPLVELYKDISLKEMEEIENDLKADGIRCLDLNHNNVGILPKQWVRKMEKANCKMPESFKEKPIVIFDTGMLFSEKKK